MTKEEIIKEMEKCNCGDDICMKCQDLSGELDDLEQENKALDSINMRYGTFLCWLFGHCFVVKKEEFTSPIEKLTTWSKIETCKRCGCPESLLIEVIKERK